MRHLTRGAVLLPLLLAALVAIPAPASAQVFTGRIDAIVADATGAVLPGVNVGITGPRDETQVTDNRGEAHFLNLQPGVYVVTADLAGFNSYRNTNVPVGAGTILPLKIALTVAGVETEVQVTAESPVINTKKQTTSTNVTYEELQQVPSSRDPWVVLQTVPGIIVDRVNVGGAESGQQSNYQAKGAASQENTWNMDGVPITDMAALGASPAYYDFDMFQEMQVTTGGADVQSATPGVQLNFVLKSGSNTPHGSTRIYFENESMQSNNMPDDLAATLGAATEGKGNRTAQYKDYGFELGGPILRDRLWVWGAYGKTDVRLITLANTPDRTILDNRSFKATGQATSSVRGSYTYFRGDKLKFGRNASPTRPPATTWNQTGPSPVHKVEGNFVVGQNTFLTGRWGYVGGGFQLTPQGGLDTPMYRDDSNIWQQSYTHYETVRPQYHAAVDGNHFMGRHELKFGFSWRRADVDSKSIVPADGIITYHEGYPTMTAEVTAWVPATATRGQYTAAYLGDAITFDRLTLNVGARWDRQAASVKELSQAGNPLLPALLPDITGAAAEDVVVWNSVTPRIGMSYALNEARKTIARASYAIFASQLNATAGGFLSTVQYRGVYFYNVTDVNGNRFVDPAEIAGRTCTVALANAGQCDFYGFNLDNPGNVSTPIHSVGDYNTPLTHEVILGMDHELMPNFGVSGSFTWRRFTNFVWRNNGLRASDYVQVGTLTGNDAPVGSYSIPLFGVAADRIPANRNATTYQEREGYSQRYLGFELAATKRLSNRWMARFGFSSNDHREYFAGPQALTDPTSSVANPNIDGGEVVRSSGGSGKSSIYQVLPKYQFIATGLYQGPWGLNFAGNVVARQGFSRMYNRQQVVVADPLASRKTVLLVDDVTAFRLPGVTSLDLRVGKLFTLNRVNFNIDLDVFNALNASTVLGRQYRLGIATSDTVQEIMNPRILRLGLRVNF